MRLVRIRLHHSYPFWFLADQIRLDTENPISGLINIDTLDDEQCKIINESAKLLKISLFDSKDKRVKSLNDLTIAEGNYDVSIDDVDEEPNFPEMVSVTIGDSPEESIEVQAPDYSEEAVILLNQNGHTVKKAILSLPNKDASLHLLHAMLQAEEQDKARNGVINAIMKAIGEY